MLDCWVSKVTAMSLLTTGPTCWGGNVQQPRLPHVNSSTVTELFSNSNYEMKKGKVAASRRQSLHFRRVFSFREATLSEAVQYFPSL